MCGLHGRPTWASALFCKSWYRLAFCWQAIYVVWHFRLDRLRGSQCPHLIDFSSLASESILTTAPSFFIVLCRLVPTCTSKWKTPRTFCSRGLNKLVYTMSTYPPGICSNDGVKSPRMLVLYTAATSPIGANNCPQRVCCFSDMLQVLVIVCLLSPGIQKCYFNGCFWRFSSNQRYIHSYISFKICCQEKKTLV